MPGTPKQKRKNSILELYLARKKNFVPGISSDPSPGLHFCIVIPCFNEPDIISTLDSLKNNILPAKATEIIVVVNSPENTLPGVLNQNLETIHQLRNWKDANNREELSLQYIHKENIPKKLTGAGHARQIGMDEAIHRFILAGNPDGVIISLDADTICEGNYLQQIEKFYHQFPMATGCNINFEHNLDRVADENLKSSIIQYELYLRYFKEALKITSFPHAFHTIGSCFSVKAQTYCKQGGMKSNQAGEDFYFLQKVFYLGNFYELNSAMVYPLTRISDRVVFGTGASMKKMEGVNENLKVYSFESFLLFKELFNSFSEYYEDDQQSISRIKTLPEPFLKFLAGFNTFKKLEEIKNNVTREDIYKKRLFHYFNNFFVIKGLNHMHQNLFAKTDVLDAAKSLLLFLGENEKIDVYRMLLKFREMQKQGPVNLL